MTDIRRPTGRRRGPTRTRQAILDAALELFAQHGYEGASLRAITDRAGVDVALVKHFFGGKEGLFDAAILNQSNTGLRMLANVADEGTAGFGRRFADAYLAMWEVEPSASTIRALFRAALESDRNLKRLREVLSVGIAEAVATGLNLPGFDQEAPRQSTLRLQLFATQLLGICLARYVFALAPLADMPRTDLVDYITALFDQQLPAGTVQD